MDKVSKGKRSYRKHRGYDPKQMRHWDEMDNKQKASYFDNSGGPRYDKTPITKYHVVIKDTSSNKKFHMKYMLTDKELEFMCRLIEIKYASKRCDMQLDKDVRYENN